ncbi:MAG: hypothetical protein WCV62_04680 [Candidatus Peribacteraceae bacterium]|jgi:hypothetical protein
MTPSDVALDRVHTLYILQTKFIISLDNGLRSPTLRAELISDVRTFHKLLGQADWRYMGGPDVLDSLRELHGEVKARLDVLQKKGPKKGTRKKRK